MADSTNVGNVSDSRGDVRGVVLIARLNPVLDRLEALGFGVCDGVPCFRGIRVGMAWSEAKGKLSTAVVGGEYLEFPLTGTDIDRITISPSADNARVDMITVWRTTQSPRSATAATLVLRYGIPCRVRVSYSGGQPVEMILFYPASAITLRDVTGDPFNPHDLGIDINSPAFTFHDMTGRPPCNVPRMNIGNGPWRGFTSAAI